MTSGTRASRNGDPVIYGFVAMKYKNLKSFAHNFTHSFVSYTNYVDGGFVIDDLHEVARSRYEGPLRIYWIPEHKSNVERLSDRVEKSIHYFRNWLPEHAENHDVDISSIQEFTWRCFGYRLIN